MLVIVVVSKILSFKLNLESVNVLDNPIAFLIQK